MPSLFHVGSYVIYFWSNEKNEAIHIHVSKGIPTENATKIWLTKDGGGIVASNSSRIPTKDLNKILDIISAEFFIICNNMENIF